MKNNFGVSNRLTLKLMRNGCYRSKAAALHSAVMHYSAFCLCCSGKKSDRKIPNNQITITNNQITNNENDANNYPVPGVPDPITVKMRNYRVINYQLAIN